VHRPLLTSVLASLLVAGVTTPAAAAPPTIDRWTIDEHFYDDWVSEQCGFDVWAHVTGHAAFRMFDGEGTGPLSVFTINATLVLSSGDRSYKLKDVGADVVQQRPDGSVDVSIIGQVPFGHKGLYRFDPNTGDVLHEPTRQTFDEIWTVCEALAG
jgi:hypothetical protein